MTKTRRSHGHWWIALGGAALAGLAAANWGGIALALAVSRASGPATRAEGRPALLRDATWNDPASALLFRRAFSRGVPESSLLGWLDTNRFTIDRTGRHAERRIRGIPCNEQATIEWTRGPGGTIEHASATLSEAGCL